MIVYPKPWWEDSQNIEAFQNGGELESVTTSKEENLMPVGAMHRELNHIDDDLGLTHKGIPVILNVDDSITTIDELKEAKEDIVQSAEIERHEIIFSKETTDFIEENRKKWNEKHDSNIELEVGKRITKEILFNTKDEDEIIPQV